MDIVAILFKSKIRQKILSRFFADESKKFYINEMAKLVGTTQGTCRRELNRLVDTGILSSSREGNLQYYQINKHGIFYKEFSSIIHKTIGIEGHLRSALREIEGVIFAFIFGSYAKKEMKPESDIDIAVIGSVSEDQLIKTVRDIEKVIGREINYHVYTEEELKKKLQSNSFIKNIIKHHIVVAGDERAFKRLLKKA